MNRLKKDLTDILLAFKVPTLYEVTGQLSQHLTGFPAFRVLLRQTTEEVQANGTPLEVGTFAVTIYDKFPPLCNDIEDVLVSQAESDIEEYRKVLRTTIRTLTRPDLRFGYKRLVGQAGRIQFNTYPYGTGTMKLFGVVMTGALAYNDPLPCCIDGVDLDVSGFVKSVWSTKQIVG